MRYLIGITVVLLGIGLFIFTWRIPFTPPYYLVVVVVLTTTIGVVVATSSSRAFIAGCRALILPKYKIDDDERNKAVELFKLLSKAVVWVSLIVFSLRMFQILLEVSNQVWPTNELVFFLIANDIKNLIYSPLIALVFFELTAFVLKYPQK